MSDAYRAAPAAPRAALREVLRRRRVGTAATSLLGLLVADFAASVVFFAADWHAWGATATALSVAFRVAFAFAVWMLTAPRPGARTSRLGWLLRAAATGLPLARLGYFLANQLLPLAVSRFVVAVAGMTYVARLFDDAEDPASAKDARLLALPLAAAPDIFLWLHRPLPTLADSIGFAFLVCLAWAGVLLFRLRDELRVADGQWWFDNGAEAPGAWVSLLRYGDGYAEVIHADGQRMRFTSTADGEQWLDQHECVPARRAMDEHLVTAMPPHVLPPARFRKWLRAGTRVRAERAIEDGLISDVPPDPTIKAGSHKPARATATSQEPRMRVADVSGREPHEAAEGMVEEDDELDADASVDTADEIDDSAALDEPEPPRARAVHDPRDPHA